MGRSPSRLQLCLLYTRKARLYPYADRSFMKSCAASSPDLVRLELVGPAHPLSEWVYWVSMWISQGDIPHSSPERFTVELQHIFVDVLDRIVSPTERLSFVLLFSKELSL